MNDELLIYENYCLAIGVFEDCCESFQTESN